MSTATHLNLTVTRLTREERPVDTITKRPQFLPGASWIEPRKGAYGRLTGTARAVWGVYEPESKHRNGAEAGPVPAALEALPRLWVNLYRVQPGREAVTSSGIALDGVVTVRFVPAADGWRQPYGMAGDPVITIAHPLNPGEEIAGKWYAEQSNIYRRDTTTPATSAARDTVYRFATDAAYAMGSTARDVAMAIEHHYVSEAEHAAEQERAAVAEHRAAARLAAQAMAAREYLQ